MKIVLAIEYDGSNYHGWQRQKHQPKTVQAYLEKAVSESYTGNFSAEIPVEQALNIVCKPFGLTFVKKDSNHFVIK